ncbi:MATE family efflux transporter [Chengkuizengella sediminis]|uniref:MATE family efflux transporter n=1 Tax=Chengkuizengella sediminis TaxID=1885917 RepID=UPI00138A60D1|nr:MATE family efflux transporter [Chengkuizengella sediminis]NDI33451.1 MATE family efflux transporter [Chengkuizengella sediminis]
MSTGQESILEKEMKEQKNEKDDDKLTKSILEGPIVPISLKLAIPILIANVLTLAYNIVDTLFVSAIDKHSTALISGLGLIFPIFVFIMAISSGLFIGISALVARGIGEKNNKLLDKTADSGLMLGLLISLLTILFGYLFSDNIVQKLAGTELSIEAMDYGLTYLYFLLPGLGFILVTQVLSGILQGEGLAKYVAFSMLISTLLNIILDPILIFGFDMGLAGASLATTISIMVSCLYVMSIFKKKSNIKVKWGIVHVDRKVIGEILKIAIPVLLVTVTSGVGLVFLNYIVSSISESAMNSWSLVGRSDEIFRMAGFAFATSTITLAGQNFGRGNLERVKQIYKTNVGLGLICCLLLALIYNLVAYPLFSLFSSVPEVVDNSVTQVRMLSLTFLGAMVSLISISIFQSTGKPLLGALLNFVIVILLTVPLAYVLVYQYDLGLYGIFISIGIVNGLFLFISYLLTQLYLKKLKFKNITNL